MPEHTQGPWRATRIEAYGQPDRLAVSAGDPELVLVTHTFDGREAQANARLIAASPELLAACELALRNLGDLEQHWKNESESFDHPSEAQERQMALDNLKSTRRTIAQARAAIAKARG